MVQKKRGAAAPLPPPVALVAMTRLPLPLPPLRLLLLLLLPLMSRGQQLQAVVLPGAVPFEQGDALYDQGLYARAVPLLERAERRAA